MIDISQHITMSEATRSKEATAHGLRNIPGSKEIQAMQYVAQSVFEPLRAYFGQPIRINSFYRSTAVNSKIKGSSPTSKHIIGEAMDLDATGGVTNKQLFDHIRKNLPFDQLIWEFGDSLSPDWVHISLSRGKNRGQILRSKRNSLGKSMYEDITKLLSL